MPQDRSTHTLSLPAGARIAEVTPGAGAMCSLTGTGAVSVTAGTGAMGSITGARIPEVTAGAGAMAGKGATNSITGATGDRVRSHGR